MHANNIHTRGFTQHQKPFGAGFIALMSAVIISAVLLLVVVSGGLTGIFARSNILDSELKARSASVADACFDQAQLLIANSPDYVGLDIRVFNSLDSCRAWVTGVAPSKTIRIQATSTPAVTNLEINYDTTAHAATSWIEVATF